MTRFFLLSGVTRDIHLCCGDTKCLFRGCPDNHISYAIYTDLSDTRYFFHSGIFPREHPIQERYGSGGAENVSLQFRRTSRKKKRKTESGRRIKKEEKGEAVSCINALTFLFNYTAPLSILRNHFPFLFFFGFRFYVIFYFLLFSLVSVLPSSFIIADKNKTFSAIIDHEPGNPMMLSWL